MKLPSLNSTRSLLILAFISAIILRVILLIHYNDPTFENTSTNFNSLLALKIHQNQEILNTVRSSIGGYALTTPFYSILIAFIWLFTPHDILYIKIVQLLLDSSLVFVIYAITKNFFSNKTAILSAFLFAFYFPEAKLSISILPDIWGAFGIVALIYAITSNIKSPTKTKTLIFFTALFSLTTLIRATISMLPFFFIPFAFLYWKPKTAIKKLSIIITTSILIFWIPLIAYNQHQYNKAFFSPLGHGLWTGLGEFENPFGAELNDLSTIQVVRNAGYDYEYGTPEFVEVLKEKAFAAIKEHPEIMISHMLKRIPKYLTLNAFFIDEFNACRNQSSFLTCIQATPWAFPFKIWDTLFGLLPLIGLSSLILCFFILEKDKRKYLLLLALPPAYVFLITWHGHHEPRYILIGSQTLIITKSIILLTLWEKIKRLHPKSIPTTLLKPKK